MTNIKIDRNAKTITASKDFLLKAGQIGTPEFQKMMEIRKDFPDFTIAEYKIKRNSAKRTYGKLTYETMRNFIEGQEQNEATRKRILNQFEITKCLALTQKGAYATVKKWFLEKYGNVFEAYRNEQEQAQKTARMNKLLYTPSAN